MLQIERPAVQVLVAISLESYPIRGAHVLFGRQDEHFRSQICSPIPAFRKADGRKHSLFLPRKPRPA
jgi:hypothetical protein